MGKWREDMSLGFAELMELEMEKSRKMFHENTMRAMFTDSHPDPPIATNSGRRIIDHIFPARNVIPNKAWNPHWMKNEIKDSRQVTFSLSMLYDLCDLEGAYY